GRRSERRTVGGEAVAVRPPPPRAPARKTPFCPTVRPSDGPPPSSLLPLHDGRADPIPPLGPRAIVVSHLLHPQQILQGAPGMARPLPDAAVRDHLVLAVDDLRALVQLCELLERLERSVGRDR